MIDLTEVKQIMKEYENNCVSTMDNLDEID